MGNSSALVTSPEFFFLSFPEFLHCFPKSKNKSSYNGNQSSVKAIKSTLNANKIE